MWGKVVEEIRKAGPKKVAVITLAAIIAVAFAYGDNSSNDAASGRTLPKTMLRAAPHAQINAVKP